MSFRVLDSRHQLDGERQAVEVLMDEILADSFPASDVPAWGSAAERVRRLDSLERQDP